jgi:hypothetical protein
VQNTRLRKETFEQLHTRLCGLGLKGGRKIPTQVKLCVVMTWLASGNSLKAIAEIWQYSTDTISSIIREVVALFVAHQNLFFFPPTADELVFENFPDAIGAMDGTHIQLIRRGPVGPYRDYHGNISQNVLACVNADMTFSYVLAGWEGSAHDARVLNDAGYALRPWCLTPYRGVRYHLKEFGGPGRRPRNAKEYFNLKHSSARNVIERSFGVLKKRFPILNHIECFDSDFQTDIILCCFMIHNFIRKFDVTDDANWLEFGPDYQPPLPLLQHFDYIEPDGEGSFRDEIAARLWDNYRASLEIYPNLGD